MTTGAHDLQLQEPASAEVVQLSEQQLELERLRHSLHEKALAEAARAAGAAAIAAHQAAALGERVAVLEDVRQTVETDIKVIKVDISAIKDQLVRSPVQQFIYSTAATLAAIYFGVLLYRIATEGG